MKTKDIVNISFFATLLAICAWICIPTVVPFTMQTFAVFLAMLVLGGKKGTIVIGIYLLLGAVGLPVFSKGTAGIGVLLGNTGGYMIGWLILGMIMIFIDRISEKDSEKPVIYRKRLQAAGMMAGLIISYLFGTWWFITVYAKTAEAIGFSAALGICVIPFVVPDMLKLALAFSVSKRIRKLGGFV